MPSSAQTQNQGDTVNKEQKTVETGVLVVNSDPTPRLT